MFGRGSQELLVILVILLVRFGANRLPQLAEHLAVRHPRLVLGH